jgi:hypothetical protein
VDFSNWDLGQWIVIGLCAVLIVWYVVAGYLNRKRGILIYRWLREGLEKIGEITNVGWIGSSGSGGQIVLKSADAPFKSVEVIFLMESRELLPLWLINLLRNKRDVMILKAALRSPPTQEVEVARSGDREFSRILALEQKPPYTELSAPEGFQIAQRGRKNPQGIQQLEAFLAQEGATVQRISLGHKTPHLVLHAFLAELMDTPAEDFFSSVGNWLQSI